MKNKWFKLGYLLLGATLVLSSCVDTEESPEVIEMRKAAAAKLNADVSYRLAEARLRNADAAIHEYQSKYDSARLKNDADMYAAEAQTLIQEAKNALLLAQIDFEKKTKALQVEKLNDPLLTALIKDYTAYYNGGELSNGLEIEDGIFDLQENILEENGIIISLQSDKENLTYLQKEKETQLRAMQIYLASNQALLKVWEDARTSGNYDAAITAAFDLLAKSNAEYERLQKEYDVANSKAIAANAKWQDASELYNSAEDDKDDARTGYWNIISGYGWEETIAYNAFMDDYNTSIANENSTQTVLSTWTSKYNTALSEKNTALAAKNTAYAAYIAAQEVINSVTAAGGTPTAAQTTDRDTKLTAYTNASNAYTTKSDIYDDVASGYEDAKDDYEDAKSDADDMRADLASYNKYKSEYAAADSKLPALKADRDAKKDEYFKLAHVKDSLEVLTENAYDIKELDDDAVTALRADRLNVLSYIGQYKSQINDINETIAVLTKEIANLQAGIDINNGNQLVDAQIKISQDKIKVWQDLLTKYQAEVTALKAKIDAQ